MSTPSISVVVPTYQRASLVGEAISSVLRQTCADFELLGVDDGSTDETAAVVTGFHDDRLRLVSLQHQGRSRARNEGVARARGDLVVFLDSDDQATPAWLEELRNAARDPTVAVVCCGAHVVEEGLDDASVILPRPLGPVYSNRVGLFRAGTCAIRREVFAAVGGYDGSLAFSENSELAIRLVAHCDSHERSFATVNKPLVRIRKRRGPGTHVELQERLDAIELILERHGDRYRRASVASYANHEAIAAIYADLYPVDSAFDSRAVYRLLATRPDLIRVAGDMPVDEMVTRIRALLAAESAE